MTGADPDDQLVLSVVKGRPTDEELAALVVVFSATRTTSGSQDGTRSSGWSAYWRSVRRPFQPGPDAWRLSARQR